MDSPTETQLAKASYNWLKVSPVLTLPTVFIIQGFGIGAHICGNGLFHCGYDGRTYVDYIIGIIVSALWHLILLQYANNKESEFIRLHGRKALAQAGVRTGVALFGVTLDWATGAAGAFVCFTILGLLIIWAVNASQSKGWVEGNSPPEPDTAHTPDTSVIVPAIRPTAEMLDQILSDLQSADNAVALKAIHSLELYTEVNQPVLKELELLADEDEDMNIRMDARVTFNRLKTASQPIQVGTPELTMSETEKRDPREIVNDLYEKLKNSDDAVVFSAMAELKSLSYSSEAIRRQLEQLSVKSGNIEIRTEALALLGLAPNRAVQQRFNSNKLDRSIRHTLLQEINEWVKSNLIDVHNADVIRRRYDFDIAAAPQTPPAPAPAQQVASTPKAETPAPVAAPSPKSPPEPRPSLLQTLTSEASIKVYLYLGAFFVIAAAAILGAVVPELRLPILIIGTLIFGGLAIAIKKRLPQPSFALFIVFSFLLLITANSVEESLRTAYNSTQTFSDIYWAITFLIMAAIWAGSTWLYESRLFSITAFGVLILATIRIGDAFEAETALYTLLLGVAALIGLAGTWLLKKWRDEKFALPLFFAAQLLQAVTLAISFVVFGINAFNTPSSAPLWNMGYFFTWGLGTVFFLLSNGLFPFFIFPWLAAATLIPMPWFLNISFRLENLGSAFVMFIWGAILAIGSEVFTRFTRVKKYSLPVLLASMPGFALGIISGFFHEFWLGLMLALGVAILYTVLHILQSRWWLWTLALLSAIVAYFTFFQLDFMRPLDIFIGYQVAGISILLLLPDLVLKKDWSHNPQWRLPLRIYGALFALYLSFALLTQDNSGHIAIVYALYTVFFAVYAIAYRNTLIGYLPAAYLPLAIIYTLNALDIDAWLPTLTGLAILYYLTGVFLRNNQKWGGMFRNSGLALGTLLSFTALILTKETGGWYALASGLLFIAEMYLTKNGWFEVGAPALFTLGIYLILRDFNVTQTAYHLLAYALVWILADLLAHLTFTNPRPLNAVVRAIGGILAFVNYIYLFTENDAVVASIGFGIYALLFLTVSLLYRQPNLFYAFTLTLPLFVTFLFRTFEVTKWIHPVIVLAMLYYVAGALLRFMNRAKGWDQTLLYSGLGVGVAVSFAAPILGGLDASIPVAIAATLWAFEAFTKRNAWLAFPANILYVLSYFIILFELNVNEPQYFSIGTALFGLIQHYLLTRTESNSGAFVMGMFSQFVLLGTTYIEMVSKNALGYFFLLFVQSLVILVYGLVIRSRSLTFFPIGFVVLGVVTVVYSALKGIGTIFVIGCTGILLLMLGVAAVLLRERIAKLGEKLSDWKA